MIRLVAFTLMTMATGFTLNQKSLRASSGLMATTNRRDALAVVVIGLIALPELSYAKPASTFFFEDNLTNEPSQMATDGKTDLNAAFVVRANKDKQCVVVFYAQYISFTCNDRATTKSFRACTLTQPARLRRMDRTHPSRTFTRFPT